MGLFFLGPHICFIFRGEAWMYSYLEVWCRDRSPSKDLIYVISTWFFFCAIGIFYTSYSHRCQDWKNVVADSLGKEGSIELSFLLVLIFCFNFHAPSCKDWLFYLFYIFFSLLIKFLCSQAIKTLSTRYGILTFSSLFLTCLEI